MRSCHCQRHSTVEGAGRAGRQATICSIGCPRRNLGPGTSRGPACWLRFLNLTWVVTSTNSTRKEEELGTGDMKPVGLLVKPLPHPDVDWTRPSSLVLEERHRPLCSCSECWHTHCTLCSTHVAHHSPPCTFCSFDLHQELDIRDLFTYWFIVCLHADVSCVTSDNRLLCAWL